MVRDKVSIQKSLNKMKEKQEGIYWIKCSSYRKDQGDAGYRRCCQEAASLPCLCSSQGTGTILSRMWFQWPRWWAERKDCPPYQLRFPQVGYQPYSQTSHSAKRADAHWSLGQGARLCLEVQRGHRRANAGNCDLHNPSCSVSGSIHSSVLELLFLICPSLRHSPSRRTESSSHSSLCFCTGSGIQ